MRGARLAAMRCEARVVGHGSRRNQLIVDGPTWLHDHTIQQKSLVPPPTLPPFRMYLPLGIDGLGQSSHTLTSGVLCSHRERFFPNIHVIGINMQTLPRAILSARCTNSCAM
jgi:hypothetical protein